MKIAILGAGWYGCHLSSILIQRGHDVEVFEMGDSAFSGASKKNQNRLHLGFHYPRNFLTRKQSQEGYEWFVEHYSSFIVDIENNYYCVAKDTSLLDFQTYLQIMNSSGQDYDIINNSIIGLENIEGIINVNEKVIDNNSASIYFNKILKNYIKLNKEIKFENEADRGIFSLNYDYVLDCTWKSLYVGDNKNFYFEPCIYFYYENVSNKKFAITIMDGKFFSLYPYKDNIYTLTSVEHTPLSVCETFTDANRVISNYAQKDIMYKRDKFIDVAKYFYPEFSNDFKYLGHELSIKTKMKDSSDYRGTSFEIFGNYVSIFSGKIDTIHVVEKKVLELIR